MRFPAGEREHGQATVEFVALLPLLVIVGLAVWQAVVAGQAIWLAGAAARAAARAAALGAEPAPAARDTLPPRLEEGLRVRVRADGGVTVTVRVPSVFGTGALGSTSARSRFARQTP